MRCTSCQSENPPQFQFCGQCGAVLANADRYQLTVMFCEVVNPTAIVQQLDPEDLHDVFTLYQETCAAVVRRCSGYIARQLSGAVLAYFGYPHAHAEAPQLAVQTGLALLAELPDMNARIQTLLGTHRVAPLQIRIGIHTGITMVSEMGNEQYAESMALGDTPNIAARILALANANTLVISASTYHLIKEHFTSVSLGPHTLKGIDTPLPLYQIVTP